MDTAHSLGTKRESGNAYPTSSAAWSCSRRKSTARTTTFLLMCRQAPGQHGTTQGLARLARRQRGLLAKDVLTTSPQQFLTSKLYGFFKQFEGLLYVSSGRLPSRYTNSACPPTIRVRSTRAPLCPRGASCCSCARELLSFPHARSVRGCVLVQSRNCVLLFEDLFQERLNVLVHLLSSGFVVMQSHALADALVVRRKRLVRLFA